MPFLGVGGVRSRKRSFKCECEEWPSMGERLSAGKMGALDNLHSSCHLVVLDCLLTD